MHREEVGGLDGGEGGGDGDVLVAVFVVVRFGCLWLTFWCWGRGGGGGLWWLEVLGGRGGSGR